MMRFKSLAVFLNAALLLEFAGCGSNAPKKDETFQTSGSKSADQRADEQVAKVQQLRGEGMNQSDTHRSLYERLGGDEGLKAIVNDFVDRAIADPRVNWNRKGIESGGVLGVHKKSETWDASQANVAQLKKHIVQFLSLATSGPTHYDGLEMKGAHAGMAITNAEFDASVGDFKAALDAHNVRTQEQKEILAIIETTRPQIVEQR